MRTLIATILLSSSALACSFFPPTYKVAPSFSVVVTNTAGPVVGLKLRVTYFKSDEFLKLSGKPADAERFVVVVATAVTGPAGVAHFDLKQFGTFDLQPEHPASRLDWVSVEVSPKNTESTVTLKWPYSEVLKTKRVKGNISDGLFRSSGRPLSRATLSLHRLVTFEVVASTSTGEDGSFEFDIVPPGAYFLRVRANGVTPENEENSDLPHGDIAVQVDPGAPGDLLLIAVQFGSCGLFYDLKANKDQYKPVACFKGGKPVECTF